MSLSILAQLTKDRHSTIASSINCVATMMRLLLPALLLGFGQCEAADVITPVEMQKKMGFGINLGNRLDLWEQSAKEVKEVQIPS